jgi:hypothetical protein
MTSTQTRTTIIARITFLILIISLIGCSSTKSIPDTSSMERDGSTQEKAVVVKSINAEYEWIKTNYPGSKVTRQALLGSGKKHFDLLTFVTRNGETREAYFDISSFFGKF